MITKRGGDSPVQMDGATLFGGLGVALMCGSSAVGIPVGLGLETPLPMVLLAVPCFVVFVIGAYVLAAVFVPFLPLPAVRYRGGKEKVTVVETQPKSAPEPNLLKDPEELEVKKQQEILAKGLFGDSKTPSKRKQKSEG